MKVFGLTVFLKAKVNLPTKTKITIMEIVIKDLLIPMENISSKIQK